MNTVSTPDSCRPICAIWKLVLEVRHRSEAPRSQSADVAGHVDHQVAIEHDADLVRWAVAFSSISDARGDRRAGVLFWGFRTVEPRPRRTARQARSTTSRCPLWNGSNEPGNRAVFTVTVRRSKGLDRVRSGRSEPRPSGCATAYAYRAAPRPRDRPAHRHLIGCDRIPCHRPTSARSDASKSTHSVERVGRVAEGPDRTAALPNHWGSTPRTRSPDDHRARRARGWSDGVRAQPGRESTKVTDARPVPDNASRPIAPLPQNRSATASPSTPPVNEPRIVEDGPSRTRSSRSAGTSPGIGADNRRPDSFHRSPACSDGHPIDVRPSARNYPPNPSEPPDGIRPPTPRTRSRSRDRSKRYRP